jgi:hypothetical protein
MSQQVCPECSREYDAAFNSECPFAASHNQPDDQVGPPMPVDAAADAEVPTPLLASDASELPPPPPFDATSGVGAAVSTDSVDASELPPPPPPPPFDAAADSKFPPLAGTGDSELTVDGKRYDGRMVFLSVLGTLVGFALVASLTVFIGAVLGFLVLPFVAGARIRSSKTVRPRSIWMGVLIGTLLVPVVAFGVCVGFLNGAG